jgi:quercetin dioxygenase-like cupin family protein
VRRRHVRSVAAAAACGLAAFTAGFTVQAAERMVVTPIEEARFVPIDPARPDGAQVSVLWGDPAQGPSAMYLRFKKGGGVLHRHTADYHLVVLQGTMKHWSGDQQEAQARPLGPGSFWFQPGQQAHADSCLTDECLMFVKWEGKRDGVAVDPAR